MPSLGPRALVVGDTAIGDDAVHVQSRTWSVVVPASDTGLGQSLGASITLTSATAPSCDG
jgi:hypothetical protein